MSKNHSDVIIYKSADGLAQLAVHLENEDVWLTQKQLVDLYQAAKSTVSEHIKNIYTDEELTPEATVRKIRTVQKEGNREVSRALDYYNLDMITALGYRVSYKITTRFRQWATQRLKEYKKYKAKTLSTVEKDYLKTIAALEKTAKKESRKK